MQGLRSRRVLGGLSTLGAVCLLWIMWIRTRRCVTVYLQDRIVRFAAQYRRSDSPTVLSYSVVGYGLERTKGVLKDNEN